MDLETGQVFSAFEIHDEEEKEESSSKATKEKKVKNFNSTQAKRRKQPGENDQRAKYQRELGRI